MGEVEFGCFAVVVLMLNWMMRVRGEISERGEKGSRLGRIWLQGRVFRVAILGHEASSNYDVGMTLPY